MKSAIGCLLLAVGLWAADPLHGQVAAERSNPNRLSDTGAYEIPKLFASDTVVRITLATNLRAIARARTGPTRYRPARLSYADTGGATVTVPLRVRGRGHWRRTNCEMAPLLLNFWTDSSKKTLFARVGRGRLVVHCRNTDTHDQYLLQEYQLYRVYNLLTPLSHRARLAHVTYMDSASGTQIAARHGFILEDDDAMAKRNGARQDSSKGAKAGDLDAYTDALVGVFQYMIGGTDWSVAGLHNVQLVKRPDGTMHAVAYDFDWSGAVNASYAKPDYRLPISTVRQRLFRGYCAPPEEYARVFALFNDKKPAIYALYADHIGQLMKPDVVRRTLEYFDEFYATISDPKRAAELVRGCKQAQ